MGFYWRKVWKFGILWENLLYWENERLSNRQVYVGNTYCIVPIKAPRRKWNIFRRGRQPYLTGDMHPSLLHWHKNCAKPLPVRPLYLSFGDCMSLYAGLFLPLTRHTLEALYGSTAWKDTSSRLMHERKFVEVKRLNPPKAVAGQQITCRNLTVGL